MKGRATIRRRIRGVKAARSLARFLTHRRAESTLLAALLMTLLVIVMSSIAILQFELPARGNIAKAQDALWWAISTMTTVGYGDTYPISPEGRTVAVFLMAAGVGLFGTLSGLMASWFLAVPVEEADSDLTELKTLVVELRGQITRLSAERAR